MVLLWRSNRGYINFMSWTVEVDDTGSVRARFEGILDEAGGRASAAALVDLLDGSPQVLVFDVGAMQGYRRGARQAWQELLWPRRAEIQRIELIGANSWVRMGASVLAMALGVPLIQREVLLPEVETAPRREPSRAAVVISRLREISEARAY